MDSLSEPHRAPLVGYCTNVHPGRDLPTTLSQLETHAVAVRQELGWHQLGVGLWLSRRTAAELLATESGTSEFRRWLEKRGLVPYTLNGFPYGDFHQDVVKHAVYQPTWLEPARYDYTLDLAKILCSLRADHGTASSVGTISTLPIGWPSDDVAAGIPYAAQQLRRLADELAELHDTTGCLIDVCIEPEPGCVLGDLSSTLEFFREHLLVGTKEQSDRVLRHLSICYDTCHAGVMHDRANEMIPLMRESGIRIGKVQVSSALEVDFDRLSPSDRSTAWEQLRSFVEPRYLHQTQVYFGDNQILTFDDLPRALEHPEAYQRGTWTVHFHVPISESMAGCLGTTQAAIFDLIDAVATHSWQPTHWEVETYAWNVLPAELQSSTLSEGIAREVRALKTWLTESATK